MSVTIVEGTEDPLGPEALAEYKAMDDSEMARRPKCNTCGDKDKDKKDEAEKKGGPPADNNQKYPDGGYHRGGSSAGVDPSQMSTTDYVAKGGATEYAPDGGYHFGGSSAGRDMSWGGTPNGYTGTLVQHSLGDCVTVSSVNAAVKDGMIEPGMAQQYAMKLDTDLGLTQGPGGTAATNGLNGVGYANVTTQSTSTWYGGTQLSGDARTVVATSPSALAKTYGANSSYVATVQANQQSIGLPLSNGAHAMTVESVYTGANGTQMVSIANPWGANYHVPVNQLPNYGITYSTTGALPAAQNSSSSWFGSFMGP